ncbi:glutathione S-transferase N-terminal domain-containing protein [Bradyrhizobium sp. U87765 SZCCT0131]|uniref:glutathione S-transferase N-terminal domain-containing protein n=1 Tax=unclassified Bradyrhizobium TaxID=2631580 RepID=UPI001BAD873E|nr:MULTISPECIES: glutathione S-transferase N-terminal domain-containing protein [unclassified Bradyrhizobium]MBR1220823.1 glutathione S-transferase N-terminal domain-containing protein [Bradyrhizobium sp. U87765 SZCCT0131]MBR1260357.1 glutathione S-transferase N-terminal domain-containing protein [Bradyrhizobium sp. U87765 SZCCT0134]MBR1307394.1 glutathione S-transferase N-terminal domain-containing protein [Bradyrhizobium sp. U87765 SZCCT0110]MBR1321348.1 glutathione S-transferase N-terminal d
MDLYFSPLACSMATRIALYEAGADAAYVEVDPKSKQVLRDGSDFTAVNPLGLVPTLRTDDGVVLTENAAILQYVADRFPDARISAADAKERSRLQQWLCFIGTELHKGLFVPLLDRKAPAEVHAYTLKRYLSRLDYLNGYLDGREFVLDHFSVADAYLATVLNWSMATPMIDFKAYPAVTAYLTRMRARPSIARAMAEEIELYKAEIARHKAA